MTKEEIEFGNEEKKEEFLEELRWLFKSSHGPKHPIKMIAPELNISPDSLTKYVRGDLTFPVYHIPALVNATGDRSILDYIVDRCNGFKIVADTNEKPKISLSKEIETLTIDLGQLVQEKCEALQDGVLTTEERHILAKTASEIAKIAEQIVKNMSEAPDAR